MRRPVIITLLIGAVLSALFPVPVASAAVASAACNRSIGTAAVTVRMRDRATVAPATVYCVKDVADVIGDPAMARRIGGITLATGPLAGVERPVDSSYIRLKIKAANLLTGTVISGAQQTMVTGTCATVSSDRLTEEAKACVLGLLPQDGRTYDVTVERAPQDLLVDGSADYIVSPKLLGLAARPGMNSVSLEVISKGKVIGKSICALKVKALGEVVVAAGQIKQGEPVNTNNTRIESREVGSMDTSHQVAAKLNDGRLVAKRTISAGALVGANDVQSPPVIRKGDSVTVVVKCGSVRLTTTATAKQDAWQGDVVAVRPEMSSSDLRGTVSDRGIIELAR
jgi:flagellar basal body P-ring formation protein FlgA